MGTFIAAAMTMVDAVIRVNHNRNRCFAFVINTMGTFCNTGSAFHTFQNVDNRILIFSHLVFPPLYEQMLNCIKEITDNDDANGTDRDEDAQQLWLHSLTEHDDGRQGQGCYTHHKTEDNAKLFLDFVLSRGAQERLAQQFYRRPVRSDIQRQKELSPLEDIALIDYSVSWASENHDHMLERWSALMEQEAGR